jgi:hypothetical protein
MVSDVSEGFCIYRDHKAGIVGAAYLALVAAEQGRR